MNQEFDEMVKDSMTWFTDEVDVPAGLAAQARENVRRQRRARLGWIGSGTAVAAAAAVVIGTVASGGAGGSVHRPVAVKGGTHHVGHGLTVQTTSVVIHRVDRALAKAVTGNPVAYTREKSTGARLVVLVPHSGPVEFSPNLIAETWTRGGLSMTNYVTPAGRVLFSDQRNVSSGKSVERSVSYQHRAWWGGTYAAPGATKTTPACTMEETDLSRAQWSREIKKLLSCGAAFAGYQQVDGVKTVKLKLSSTIKNACAGSTSPGQCTPVPVGWNGTLWANASTYLPVRLAAHGDKFSFQIDFAWLAPTAANLAKLQPQIPSSFRHV